MNELNFNCPCGYQAAGMSDWCAHGLICDHSKAAPIALPDDGDEDVWGEQATARYITLIESLLSEAAELLAQQHTPDTGQLRTAWDRECDEWVRKYNALHLGEGSR